eukprot:CAMPEP_0171414614 /NCGR_PEP_ID=MMETSP0880-20121228/37814_1 /TAXON_ID=67004 /ORGANISM="Thalassiosira weissflogii, Strain CCMP1336" /LENGTH=66 /DNA_ID=CAMNT_0011932613 /DNA_START=32 /DNA_END=233 /DNA_ORIENTATION=+
MWAGRMAEVKEMDEKMKMVRYLDKLKEKAMVRLMKMVVYLLKEKRTDCMMTLLSSDLMPSNSSAMG